jgi:hypothetical protein
MLKKIEAKGERYIYDGNYTLEVWQIEDINEGRKFEFYLTSNESIYKMYMYGMKQYQPAAQKTYTKTEMIKMHLPKDIICRFRKAILIRLRRKRRNYLIA